MPSFCEMCFCQLLLDVCTLSHLENKKLVAQTRGLTSVIDTIHLHLQSVDDNKKQEREDVYGWHLRERTWNGCYYLCHCSFKATHWINGR